MALTLDPTLAAAQDSASRKPIVEIISSKLEADIPFDGVDLTITNDEQGQSAITHSSGRIIVPHIFSTRYINFVYTDTNRTEFTTVQIDVGDSVSSVSEISITELTDGNIGLIVAYTKSTTYYLDYYTLTPVGAIIATGNIISFPVSLSVAGLSVITLDNNTYLVVYPGYSTPNYNIFKRTSSDFINWSASSVLSISGLTANFKKYNPSLIQITTGDIFIWFDHIESIGSNDEELTNIYYSISADDGSTWSAAVAITSFTDFTIVGKHPIAVQKVVNTMIVVFYEQRGSLWFNNIDFSDSATINISDLKFDPVTRKLNGFAERFHSEISAFSIDVDTWAIDDIWDTTTTPAFSTAYINITVTNGDWVGDAQYVTIGLPNFAGGGVFAILDTTLDTITQYNFSDSLTYSLITNIDYNVFEDGEEFVANFIDSENDKVWCLLEDSLLSKLSTHVGYILLSDVGPTYNFTTVNTYNGDPTGGNHKYFRNQVFRIYESSDYGITTTGQPLFGMLRVFLLSVNATHKIYTFALFSSFPQNPLIDFVYMDDAVWGIFEYSALPAESSKRGLVKIDITTDIITYYRPSWASLDEYGFHSIEAMGDGRLLLSGLYGITIFEPGTATWTLFDNDSIPGLTPSASDLFYHLAYDQANGMIFGSAPAGLAGFLAVGFIKQAQYISGSFSGGWSFGGASDFVQGIKDYEAVVALDPGDQSMYAFWTSDVSGGSFLKWDKEESSFDLTSYILIDTEVVASWNIEGQAATLTFAVSDGHLFDNSNIASLFNQYLAKGRNISLRFGENISSVEYWEDQGQFIVAENKLSYRKPDYPSMAVKCEDISSLWDQNKVTATQYYEIIPDLAIEDVLTTYTNLESSDISLPTFDAGFSIETQWLDSYISDIVNELAERFEYFVFVGMDGVVTARKIADTNPTDHAYTNTSKLYSYTPDDTFSSFLNRIIITGQERGFIEVLFAEERVASQSGTVGWWGADKDHTHFYSDDKSRRCRSPRLEVIETATSIGFKLAGSITESISFVDPNDKFCVVEIDVPSLVPILIAGIVTYFLGNKLPDEVIVFGIGASGGVTIPIGRWAESIGLLIVMNVLASVGSYQYDIYAQPVGNVRRSVQGQANDVDLQNKVGVITEKSEGFLCYGVSDCTAVANFRLLLEQLQRKRVKFEKVTHLQDEVGDTITHPHPYTGATVKFLVNRLTRRLKIASLDNNKGHFTDMIEGWRI